MCGEQRCFSKQSLSTYAAKVFEEPTVIDAANATYVCLDRLADGSQQHSKGREPFPVIFSAHAGNRLE